MTASLNRWLARPTPNPQAGARLFCLPFAGVGPSAYRGWAHALGTDVDVVVIHLPGREGRYGERPLSALDEVVAGMIDAMTSALDRPYALIGHSLGGLLAFEAARALRSRGLPTPAALFVSAARAPHLAYPFPPLAAVPDDRLLQEVNARYEGSVPHAILDNAELHELFIPPLRSDMAVLESYAYREEAPLDCPLSVFGGTRDRTLPTSALEGWAMHTRREFRLRMLDEGHLFLQSARETLVDAVRHELMGVADRA